MTEKYIVYRDGDDIYDIAESDAAEFESQYPNATMEMRDGDDIYDISPADKADFLSQYPNAVYAFDLNNEPEMTRKEQRKARREEKANDDKTSWGETVVKSTGSAGVRTGKMVWDALLSAAANSVYIPEVGENKGIAERLPSIDQMVAEGWDEIEFSKKMGETADRLSREADPTGGEKGFWDLLLKEGKVGKALQKGLATAIESAPATLSAANPYTMGLYLIGNAASKFIDESVENPDIPKEKRAAYAIGSAAFEQAVEKFADPIFKYIGGGKVAKGFTEGAAKEIIEDVTKEATESIAKRIWRVIKNTGKDMLGEGAEEIITGVGTDALGSALDLIEGNKDYGFAAQFEEYKEDNPNATKEEFAWGKAKEYADAFIGGALSGGYMSGPVQAVTEFANVSNQSKRENFVANYQKYGNALDYGNMYDTDSDVAEASAELEQSFVNEKGEAILTTDFLGSLSADEAAILSQRGELSEPQRAALVNYAEKKAVQEGLEKKLDERTIAQINKNRELIDSATNEDGTIIAGNAEGRNVYVVDAQLENGVVTTPYGSSPVIVIDANTGEKFYVPSDDIKDGRSLDSKALMGDIEQTLLNADNQAREVARNTMSPRAKIKAIQPFAGKKILVDLGNGATEVYVQQIDANGNVLIKGKKGDLGGQTFLTLNGSTFYDSIYRDNDGNPVVTEAGPEVEEQVDDAPEAGVTEADDFRDYVGPILINGVPVNVEVTQQDDASDTIVYTYVDENGVTRRGTSSISEFKNAIVKQQPEAEVTPVPAPIDETPVTPEPSPEVDEAPIEDIPEVGETPTPQPIDWDALFESDKEAFFSELQNYFGDDAVIMLEDFIDATQKELDELNKAKVKGFNEIAANRQAKAIVQAKLDVLNEMMQRLAPQPVEEAPVEETPVGETPAPVEETPVEEAPVAETPVEEQPVEEVPVDETPVEPTPEPEPEPAPAPQPQPAPAPVEPEKKDGAIARLYNEFKAMVDKIAAKAAIKDFVGTDILRPAMTGIYRKNGYEYATDSHYLAKIKANYSSEQEGKIISPKTGQEIVAKFPDADRVIDGAYDAAKIIDADIDDIIAYAQAAEEIRKGMTKDTRIYIGVGNSVFDSSKILTAARMAKKHGLTKIYQKPTSGRALLFSGTSGEVMVMPITGFVPSNGIIQISDGQAVFGQSQNYGIKTPATLKGIEAAKTTLEAVLPNLEQSEINYLKKNHIINFVNGKVVYYFDTGIADNKNKAKDPNTFSALADIENNGLVIPMSADDVAKLFPETVKPVTPAPEPAPVAPKPVANPIDEAKKREQSLADLLARNDVDPAEKRDRAFDAGKAVADLFATREEYDAYEQSESAIDLGKYYDDFQRGVEESFANRGQNTGENEEESVPLGTESNGDNNGNETTGGGDLQQESKEDEGHISDDGVRRTNDGGVQTGSEENTKESEVRTSESGAEVDAKYPARKGNVSISDLKDTFGFDSIGFGFKPSTLNAIYDTMMEVAKMLGISPKSMSHGGTLGWAKLSDRIDESTYGQYGPKARGWNIVGGTVEIRDTDLAGMLHEWWHSLDNMLEWWNNPRLSRFTSSVGANTTHARPEVFKAVNDIVKAIKKSGHIDRMKSLTRRTYFWEKKEMTARAFEEYILDKLAENGIVVENVTKQNIIVQPTAEEMKVIAPAFDKLFEVLKEKEGKTPGTSVLYQISKVMEENTEVKKELGEQVAEWIKQGGNFVVMDSTEMQKALEEEGIAQNAKKKKRSMFNSDLSRAEKKKIREYILSLPLDSSFDGPLMLKADGYAYIFNTSVRFFKDNTTKKPKGDGFEILHKYELSSLTELEEKLLDATYNYGEDSGNLDEMLQILGINKRGSSDSSSANSNIGTEGGNGRLDEAEHREQTSTDRGDNGGRRDSKNVQALETPDGIVYGFVKDGVVYLDPTLINPNTAIHEYTHLWDNALMQLNPELWEKGKALMKQTPLWDEVINDPNYADIKDNEDLVASEVHSRLVGKDGAARLEMLEQEAREKGLTKNAKQISILGRLREWLNEATKWLKDAFTKWEKSELDKLSLDDFLNMPLRDLANFRQLPKEGIITNANGEVIADNKGKGKIQFSISTWEQGGRGYLVNWLNNDKTLDADEKDDIVARMDEFYENAKKYTDVYVPFGNWSDAAVKYDSEGNPIMSVIKANGDYAMNLDFSLVCKKRRPLNRLLRTLINRNAFGTYSLKERELAEINWILQEHGFEVACALCFVDAKRYRVTGVADVFAALYNKMVKALAPEGVEIAHFNYNGNPNVAAVENGLDTMADDQLNWEAFDKLASKFGPNTVEGKVARFLRDNPAQRKLVDSTDFIEADGFEAVKTNNPALLSLYNSKKGQAGPKASFGDVQYLNDILKHDKKFDVEKAYAVGGVRLQSFSDFVAHMYFDYMQLFAELAAKRLPAHAYTKEVLFAKIFGLTGMKINMSLVPAVAEDGIAPGLDKDGNYVWADPIKDKSGKIIQQGQTFPYDEAAAIQRAEGYSKNCGIIAVGISDEHITKMLNDENIPYIIPYHKSALNAIVARMTNINKYKDYEKDQNTRDSKGAKLAKGTPEFNFNEYLHTHKDATPQQAAQAYLDWCRENSYIPKFSQFAYHPNYYKLLADFNTMDLRTGEYSPQGAVKMDFPTADSPFGDVETLIKQGLQEDAEVEEKMDAEMEEVADEVEDMLKRVAEEPKMSARKKAEHLARLADERTAKINEMAESDGILSRSGDITPEMDAEYLAAVEAGDMETAQRLALEAQDKYLNELLLPNDNDEVGFKYHRGPAPKKTFKRYAVFNVKDGGFHAAYAGNATPTPVGVYLDAQNLASYTSDMVQFDDGTFATYIAGDTGADTKSKFSPEKVEELGLKGGQKWLLERGGKHSSDVPNFSQMNLGVNENGEKVKSPKTEGALPHNKLIFEIEYGISEDGDLTDYVRENGRIIKGKNQGLAKIGPNQYYDFKTNANAVGNWGIGGTFRITRLVPYSEIVAKTEQYKKDAIAEANRLYESGEISKKDRDARVKSAESIQIQKWVGGYNPADFGLSEESVKEMAERGKKMKLTDPVTYDDNGNVIPLSERFNPENPDIRYRKEARQNEAVGRLVGTARSIAIENAVNEEAAKLGVKVTYKTREEMPAGHKNDKGYFNTKTGEIVVCPENASSVSDAIQTILHEAVAHKGLRALMGDRFNEFINRVYESLDDATKAKVDALADTKYKGNKAVAMEEYMASLAETMDFENKSVWEKIKEAFEDIINSILGRNDIKIGDNELRYILRASYNHMANPRTMDTLEGWAKDKMMREEYKVNEAQPELMSRTGIDPTEASRETARKTYDRVVTQQWQEFQRQFQDAMQPVRIAIDAIQQETGNIPIEDYENYLLIQNQSSSRSRVEIDTFARNYYSPIIEQVNHIIDLMLEARHYDKTDKAKRAEAYAELKQYLIAKHGLERNLYYQTHNLRKLKPYQIASEIKKLKEQYQNEVDAINADTNLSDTERELALYKAKEAYDLAETEVKTRLVPDLRDYSGLTSLFGFEPKKFKEAEQEAEMVVDEFEKKFGRTIDDEGNVIQGEAIKALWDRVNAATSRTLRHSYESGLISRTQYDEIKGMFKFYIPLRGFDETTAEDVYSYARFEGNSFNPAVQKAGGRTSVADDPIAFIMNMAESEIAQGNKNRAKQALYNYLLNRANRDAEGNEVQNSLMQVESVWYEVKDYENGQTVHVIATPNRDAGETYEEFENRMLDLEQENKAYKSKKGKVNVGMRFQKPKNRGSHYIYLKVNGVEKAIYVNGDPKAADAVNGTYAPMPNKAEKMAKDVNRFVSSMFTNYSLEFTVRNFLRDLVYSRVNIGIKEDGEYGIKFRKNFWLNHPFKMVGMLKAYRAGKFDNADLTEDQAAFVEFMNNGGQTGYTLINSVESHKKELQRAIERMQKGIVKGGIKDNSVFKFFLGGIELLNEASELTTRFAAFKTSRDLGRPTHQSVSDAKEISVNFNTKGAQDGNTVMGAIARYFGATKYFFNAAIQGVQNIGAMRDKNRGKFDATVGAMIAFGAMWPMLNTAILALVTGDDEEEEYWKIPEYDRQNNFCITIGKGRYLKIALPIGFREMFGLGDMAASSLAGKTPRDPMRWGMDFANKVASIALPLNPLEGAVNGLSLVESGLSTILPDATQVIIQNWTNKDWKGAPLQKEYTYNQNDPQWTKAFSGNPAWITGFCKWMNENFVWDGLGVDWSPEKIDNTLSNVFGGTYSLVKKIGRTVSSAINAIKGEDEFSISSIPVVGVFTGKVGEDSFVTSTYWNMEDYYSKRLPTIKRTAASFGYTLDEVFARTEDGEARAGEHQPAMSKIYNRKNFDFMQEWYLGHKGEGDEENLGLDQIKTQIEMYKKAVNKDEFDLDAKEMLAEYEMMLEAKRRDLVNDLLELD